MGFFRNSISLLSFASIFAAGMVFTVFTLVFGGDHDGGGDHGDFGGDHDGGGDHGGDHDDGGQGPPNIFSIRGLSLLAVGFGGVGYIVMYYTQNLLLSALSGLVFGWVFSVGVLLMMRIFIQQQGSSVISPRALIGTIGEVTTGIPANGLGEVRLAVEDTIISKTATANGGVTIVAGRRVRVIAFLGGSVIVEEVTQS